MRYEHDPDGLAFLGKAHGASIDVLKLGFIHKLAHNPQCE
jgi:hypothetical protein